MNSQDAAVLILREKYLNKLRPKPKGIIGHKMVENLPHFRNQGESKRKTAKKHQIPTRTDESHKTRPSYRSRGGAAPDPVPAPAPVPVGVPLGPPVGVPLGPPVAH